MNPTSSAPMLQRVHSGRMINLLDMLMVDVDIQDIAHHLSHQCRFNGACDFHYSVAQHSVHVLEMLWWHTRPRAGEEFPEMRDIRRYRLLNAALLHDGSEAYLGDVVRPLKYTDIMVPYRQLEDITQHTINWALGVGPVSVSTTSWINANVKLADDAMCAFECRQLFTPAYVPDPRFELDNQFSVYERPIVEILPRTAKTRFLDCWNVLMEGDMQKIDAFFRETCWYAQNDAQLIAALGDAETSV